MTNRDLKPGWKWVKLGDVAIYYSKRVKDPANSEYKRYVGSNHIERFDFTIRNWGDSSEITSSKIAFEAGDYLFVGRSLYASDFRERAARASFAGVCSNGIITIRENPELIADGFLAVVLNQPKIWRYVIANATGSLTRYIYWNQLADYEFPLPPLEEQRRIAKLLWAANDVCEKLQELMSKTEVIKKKIFEGILTGELKNSLLDSNEVYENGSNVDLGGLPSLRRGWSWRRADKICDFITKGTTPSKEDTSQKAGEIPFIKVYNLTFDGSLDFSINPTFITTAAHTKELNRSKVFPGDVLMNIVGPPLGKVSIVPDTFAEWNINQAIVYFRPLDNYDSGFLAHYLLQDFTQNWFFSRSKKTSGKRNLTLEMCRDLPLPVPPESAKDTIREITELLDNCLIEVKQNLVNAQKFRHTLLNELLSDI